MFGIDTGELMVIALVALVVIGPKDLPRVMAVIGRWVGRARAMARQFRASFDEMVRETELQEMERKWREENERIMRMYPPPPPGATDSDWGKPALPTDTSTPADDAAAAGAAAIEPAPPAAKPRPSPHRPAPGARRPAPPVPERRP